MIDVFLYSRKNRLVDDFDVEDNYAKLRFSLRGTSLENISFVFCLEKVGFR